MKTVYIWEEAKEYLVNGYNETLPDNIILHLGTNDICNGVPSYSILKSVKETVDIIFNKNRSIKITLSAVIPRGDDYQLDLERQDFNLKLLRWSHSHNKIFFVDNSNLSNRGRINEKLYAVDNIHLNPQGVNFLTSNISIELKNQLEISQLYRLPQDGQKERWKQNESRGRGKFMFCERTSRSWSPPSF